MGKELDELDIILLKEELKSRIRNKKLHDINHAMTEDDKDKKVIKSSYYEPKYTFDDYCLGK